MATGALALGCKDEKTRLPFTSPITPFPPLVTGPTPVFFTVRDQKDQTISVTMEVSVDRGRTFRPATAASGAQSVVSLQGAPAGATGAFQWDPIKDLGPGIRRGVILRIYGLGRTLGLPGDTGPIDVDLTDRLDPLPAGGPATSRPVAAPLPDGSVWVAGGTSGATPQSSGARWDPTTNVVQATPGLLQPRSGAAAALLRGGQVLVVGGFASGAPSSAAEAFVFDGGVGRVTAASPLARARDGAAVAGLGDGRALVLGGRGASVAVAEVELFTPGTPGGASAGSFTPAFTDARAARVGATATATLDGRVLLAGGVDAAGAPATTALVCTATGAAASGMTSARAEHAALLLPDGRVVLAGGTTVPGDPAFALSTVEVWDPATGLVTTLPSMIERRHRPGIAYVAGQVVVFGGAGTARSATTAERLDLDLSAWTEIAGPSGTARPDAVAVAGGPGLALVAGGQAALEVYTGDAAPGGEAWDALRAVPAPRADHTASLLVDGGVLLIGGTARITSALSTVERVEPFDLTVTTMASLLRARTDHAAALLLPAGQVLVVGGRDGAGLVAEAEVYDPALDRWSPAGTLATPRARPTAVALIDGTVVVSGGVDAAGLPLQSQELWLATERRFVSTSSLPEPRADHRGLPLAGFAVLGSGRTTAGTPQATALVVLSGGGVSSATDGVARAAAGVAAPSGSGIVLVSGGEDLSGPRADAALLDLLAVGVGGAPRFLPGARPLLFARAAHESVGVLADVLLVGGRGPAGRVLDEGELFTSGGGFTPLEFGTARRTTDRRMVKARVRHTATPLPDGRVLVAGGVDERGVAIAGLEVWTR